MGEGGGRLRKVRVGGCPAQSIYYGVGGLPMMGAFWNKGAQRGWGLGE